MAARRQEAPEDRDAGRGGAAHQGLSRAKAQRGKNLAMLAALIGFVVLVYVIAIVRMGGN